MKILCAGPTSIDKKVLNAMSESKTNPDLDPLYTKYHRNVEAKISKLLNTNCPTIFMLGEAIMTLEAAICSLMEPKERVLVIYNGFFGEGFADYVQSFGGEYVKYKCDFERGIDVEELRKFLEKDSNFSIATMVHCETPSGITNDINAICNLLDEYNILSVVDSVSGIGGEYIDFDKFKVDMLLGGSQKCLSAPVGIGTVTMSQRAIEKMKNRKTKIQSYYLNLLNYFSSPDGFDFPYTMNENLVYAMDEAIDQLNSKNSLELHKKYAQNTRMIFEKCGFELYPKDFFSNTLTAVRTPEGITSSELLEEMRKRDIIISKGVGHMAEKIFRIGHMGNNINYENFKEMYLALDDSFKALGIKKASLYEAFINSEL